MKTRGNKEIEERVNDGKERQSQSKEERIRKKKGKNKTNKRVGGCKL